MLGSRFAFDPLARDTEIRNSNTRLPKPLPVWMTEPSHEQCTCTRVNLARALAGRSKLETNLNDKRQMTKTQETWAWPDFVLNFKHWGFDIVSDFGFRYSGFQFLHDSELSKSSTELIRR
jgi:hypothetical protein